MATKRGLGLLSRVATLTIHPGFQTPGQDGRTGWVGLTSTKASHAFHILLSPQKLLGITDGTALGGSILLLQRGRLRLREDSEPRLAGSQAQGFSPSNSHLAFLPLGWWSVPPSVLVTSCHTASPPGPSVTARGASPRPAAAPQAEPRLRRCHHQDLRAPHQKGPITSPK